MKKYSMVKHTRSTTLDLCVGFGSADVTTQAVLIIITNHNLLYIKMRIFHRLTISITSIHHQFLKIQSLQQQQQQQQRPFNGL